MLMDIIFITSNILIQNKEEVYYNRDIIKEIKAHIVRNGGSLKQNEKENE